MIYIASPFFNKEQLHFVRRIEDTLDAFERDFFSPRIEGVIKDMTADEKKTRMKEIFDSNIQHILDSDIIVAVIDDRDPGTMFEIGYAAALGIPIITLTQHDYQVNVMIKECTKGHLKGLMNLGAAIEHVMCNEPIPDWMNAEIEDVT